VCMLDMLSAFQKVFTKTGESPERLWLFCVGTPADSLPLGPTERYPDQPRHPHHDRQEGALILTGLPGCEHLSFVDGRSAPRSGYWKEVRE